MGYEFDEVTQGYFAHSARLAEWIVGLTIGELAFIVSQQLFEIGVLFYAFSAFSFLSIMLAILIMYVIAIIEDGKMHGVLVLIDKDPLPSKEAFDKSFDKRVGRIRSWLVNALIDFKAFHSLC
jgi:hypothetical protein